MKKTLLIIACMLVAGLVQAEFKGMGYDVAKQITERAIDKWPDDYSMQEYEIREEKEAWINLNNYRHYRISENLMRDMRARAELKWPGDYSMQWWEFERQVKAWLRLNKEKT